jgi:CBS-domain-containing membrane protein
VSDEPLSSLKPIEGADRPARRRFSWRDELLLALLPTGLILIVLFLIEALSQQRLLSASLASSAFLIYLDPQHATNTVKTLVISHLAAVAAGAATSFAFGEGYTAAAIAMVICIVAMISLDAVHPPAVSTSLGFAFRAENVSGIGLFLLALAIICLLVGLQRSMLWVLTRLKRHRW